MLVVKTKVAAFAVLLCWSVVLGKKRQSILSKALLERLHVHSSRWRVRRCACQGCVKCSATGNFLLTEKLGEVRGMMEAYGVKPNRRTYALQIEACLTEQELEVRAWAMTIPNPKSQP